MGLLAAVIANQFYWWIDPVGAIVLAVYTITNWSGTVMENAGTFSYIKKIKTSVNPEHVLISP